MSVAVGFFILFILLICSALVSGSEVAFFSLSPTDVETLKKSTTGASKRIIRLRDKPRKLLATILISNNFINIAIVILSDYLISHLLGDERILAMGEYFSSVLPGGFEAESIGKLCNFLITIVGVTFLLVLFGEVAPKIYAKLNNVRFAHFMARPMVLLSGLFRPLSSVLVNWSSKMESRFIFKRSGIDDDSKEELDKAIQLAVDSDEEEAGFLRGIIKFGNVSAKQIMKSRVDVVAVEINETYDKIIQIIKESGFSRIPVYKEDFDDVVGILYVKDLLGQSDKEPDFPWQDYIRANVMYVPESKKIDDILKDFQAKKIHMAIVVDEFGGSAGILTLEDIMEEVIGEIKDEFDEDEEVDYVKINATNYIFEGKTLLHDAARIIGEEKNVFDAYKQDADSLAGLLLNNLGQIPKKDREISLSHFKFKIVSVTKRRIEKIHLTIL